jgi:hypothetical protein
LLSLQYLKLHNNQKLKSIPGIWQCGELVRVKIHHCPELFLETIDIYTKLEFLSIRCTYWILSRMCTRRTKLAKVVLTENMQVPSIYRSGRLCLTEAPLEKSLHIENELDLSEFINDQSIKIHKWTRIISFI